MRGSLLRRVQTVGCRNFATEKKATFEIYRCNDFFFFFFFFFVCFFFFFFFFFSWFFLCFVKDERLCFSRLSSCFSFFFLHLNTQKKGSGEGQPRTQKYEIDISKVSKEKNNTRPEPQVIEFAQRFVQ